MQNDPMLYIVFTALVSAAIGFLGSAIMCAHRIRRAELDGWKQGVRFYQNREKQARNPRL